MNVWVCLICKYDFEEEKVRIRVFSNENDAYRYASDNLIEFIDLYYHQPNFRIENEYFEKEQYKELIQYWNKSNAHRSDQERVHYVNVYSVEVE